jgi:methionine biosynthesis protein MetW
MKRQAIKRETDLQIISSWISDGSRVLDLGCGRGIFLEHLTQSKGCYAVGVDSQLEKILGCVKRGVPAFHGDIGTMLSVFPDGYFDWVVCSRTLQELEEPQKVIKEALRVGKHFAVGFVNYGFWVNRFSILWHGRRVKNVVFPENWAESRPLNPLSVSDFEAFCQSSGIRIDRRHYLAGDWQTPCRFFPNLLSGYVLYAVSPEEKCCCDGE